jgi:hydroxymethylpyrimidine/phosphomethylpyrimidine kinase
VASSKASVAQAGAKLSPSPTPIAVTIAGSDSGGGAGIQADLKTFSALGVYGASVITALTAQNTQGVQGIHDVPVVFIRQQMASVFADLPVTAVKVGMLSQARIIESVAAGLDQAAAPNVVLDPVMVATSGDRLLSIDAVEALRDILMPRALLVTPNLHEAAVLTGEAVASTEDQMQAQGEALLAKGAQAVLVKGGHGNGRQSVDLLVEAAGVTRFAAPRIDTRNTHGTGCTLSAAIAAGLARGLDLHEAVGEAKAYLTAALGSADRLRIGHGAGPVHHFYAWW